MTNPGNGRTIKIPVRSIRRQLPAAEDSPRTLLVGPKDHQEVVEAKPEVEAKAEVQADADAEALTELTAWDEPTSVWQSEVETIRRQAERRAQQRIHDERRRLLNRLLVVADNLERALDHTKDNEPLRAGVQLTLDDLLGQLAQEGVEPFQALGQPFDPNLHEAVAVDGSHGEMVVQVLQTGYTLDGRLLRPAQVVVGRLSE